MKQMSEASTTNKKKHIVRKIVLLILLLAAAGAAVWFILIPMVKNAITTTYTSYTTSIGTISNSLSFSGSISVTNYETLTASGEGTVRQIYVSEEEDVVKNQKLMRLSTGETIKAGFDGTVNTISVDVGDAVSKNDSLIQVVDFENMEVSVRVDEYDIGQISVGQACKVTVTAPNVTFDSTITHINRISSSNGNSAYYTVTAGFEATANVLPGMQVTVVIPEEEATDAVILSKKALTFGADNSAYVLVQDEAGEYVQQNVEIGVDNDNYVEVKSGLTADMTVYKVSETAASSATGIAALFSSFGGGGMGGGDMPSMGGGGNMPSGMGGGNMGGGFDGGGNMGGGGMPSGGGFR